MTNTNIDETKQTLLKRLIESERYKQALGGIHKYHHPRGDYGDLIGIFNEGLMMGLESVDMHKGDPMEYLIYRGYAYMRTQIRNECNKTMIEECTVCGKMRPFRGGKCTCGNNEFNLHSRMIYIVVDNGEATIPLTSYPSDFKRLCNGCAKSKLDEDGNLI